MKGKWFRIALVAVLLRFWIPTCAGMTTGGDGGVGSGLGFGEGLVKIPEDIFQGLEAD